MCPGRRWAWDAGGGLLVLVRGCSPLSLAGPGGKQRRTLGTGGHGPSPACPGHLAADAVIVASWLVAKVRVRLSCSLAIVCFHSRPISR